jgi:hypothetical protein
MWEGSPSLRPSCRYAAPAGYCGQARRLPYNAVLAHSARPAASLAVLRYPLFAL